MISQEYILPFPYLCFYHLLNLKHLETIHNFSLNNLKLLQLTIFSLQLSRMVNFKQLLDSQSMLRIWRQPIVEAVLILHTPIL